MKMAANVRSVRTKMKMNNMSALKDSDVFCYICRSVLIEPVTVPCNHVFCLVCFEGSMQETSYCCPLCRKRISNWVRTAKKKDNLVNAQLWAKIKSQYKEQVSLKLKGEDDGLDERMKDESITPVIKHKPGEVAQEFKTLLTNYQKETDKIRQAEERASIQLIEEINNEEQNACKEINALTKQDEEIARRIQEELNKDIPSTSNYCPVGNRKASKHNKITKGPLDNFFARTEGLKPKNGLKLVERSASTESADSICSEMHHFKPIRIAPKTPPKQWPDGKFLSVKVKRVNVDNLKEVFKSMDKVPSPSKKIQSPYSAFIGKAAPPRHEADIESPRKRLRFPSEEPESGILKEINLDENSDSNSMGGFPEKSPVKSKPRVGYRKNKFVSVFSSENVDKKDESGNDFFDTPDYLTESGVEEKVVQEQRRMEKRILQEKADRELAMKLSRQWEEEEEGPSSRLRKIPKRVQNSVKKQKTLHETIARRRKK